MHLVQEYVDLVNEVISFRNTVYDKESAEKHNQCVTRMGVIATEIQRDHQASKAAFSELLFHENQDIRLWVAHHILELMDYEQPIRKKALKIIRRRARTDKTAYGLGEKFWLQDWYKQHPRDRWM